LPPLRQLAGARTYRVAGGQPVLPCRCATKRLPTHVQGQPNGIRATPFRAGNIEIHAGKACPADRAVPATLPAPPRTDDADPGLCQ